MPILEVRGVSKRYGKNQAVDDVSFFIEEGETYGLLGPNGAGKSTTIGMITGILERDSGSITVDGIEHSVTNRKSKSLIGFVPQELALYHDLSARDNLRFFARLYGLSKSEARTKTEEVLETVGLSDRAGEAVSQFSGGMARRLNIGLGLLNSPRLLILDEPTVGVDPQSRNSILESVHTLTRGGVSVLYTTHYMEEAERLCDRVGIIEAGKIRAEGTQRELVSQVGEDDTVLITLDAPGERVLDVLRALEPIDEVSSEGTQVRLLTSNARDALPLILDTLTRAGAGIRSVEVQEPDLEAVFLSLTGKGLRE
ncbi:MULTISPECIES: ABC transporter ATP-binding protein [Nocardiopsidaceae]|uniref:ABC transporter ATP-binding protein n=1 Tax=Streptomonospora nanhaiensis TaxID=1323731 RepID=A0ABY6YNM6_9ACTN|nr:ABC transporter ATP-binding protein [Streptomonospora nanhaiensis]WAE73415.1 ABC transporter ATP-binding protein [Streptomonospora nanhaiensis]